jgi:hypothetical protein
MALLIAIVIGSLNTIWNEVIPIVLASVLFPSLASLAIWNIHRRWGSRTVLAFLVAPLWVPAATTLLAIGTFPYAEQRGIYIITIIAAIFAYGATAMLGLPAFLILRARGHTAFWFASALGFGVGVITWAIFMILLGLSLGNSWTFVTHDIVNNPAQRLIFPLTGALGAAVGATLWLIARPDRERRS